jgi:hypothetical protein
MDLSALFDSFGLCPEYKVVWVNGDYVSYHNPIPQDYSAISDNNGKLSSIFEYNRKKRHLDNHIVTLENGRSISACFTVAHELKTVFLKVSPIGEHIRIEGYE